MKESFKEAVDDRLRELALEHRVPGASIAVLHDDEIWDCATGYLNLTTMVEATPDSLFQIGSITKVFTATLVMQLVDAEKVDLDAPIQSYLPDVRFADEGVSARVTVRHLLNHTSGVDGDYFGDFGYGDDAIERYVAACRDLPQLFEPGAMFSYCNAAFTVLGRLLEVMYGTTFHEVLRRELVTPLGAGSPLTLLQEIVMHRVAVGHQLNREGRELGVVPKWGLPHAGSPKGSTTCATARAVIEFARLHLDGGRGILSGAAVESMQEEQVRVPVLKGTEWAWGLGWELERWDGVRVVGHGGSTLGQTALLAMIPDRRTAVAILTNSFTSEPLFQGVCEQVFGKLCGVAPPPSPIPPAEAVQIDPQPYVGRFERLGVTADIDLREETLFIDWSFSREMTDTVLEREQPPKPLVPLGDHRFLYFDDESADYAPIHFLDVREGQARYLFDSRIAPRTA